MSEPQKSHRAPPVVTSPEVERYTGRVIAFSDGVFAFAITLVRQTAGEQLPFDQRAAQDMLESTFVEVFAI